MDRRVKIASILYLIVSGVSILYGMIYLFSPRILPFHEQFLGLSFEQLQPTVAALMLRFMRDLGGTLIALGIGTVWIVRQYLARNDLRVSPILFAMSSIALVPLEINTVTGGWYTPWWVVSILIIMVVTAFILCLRITRKVAFEGGH